MSLPLDILFIISGKIRPDSPTAGVGVLKSHLASNGMSSKIIDFNIDLYNHVATYQRGRYYWEAYDSQVLAKKDESEVPENIWSSYELKYLGNQSDASLYQGFDEFYELTKPRFDNIIDRIKDLNPKWVGISILAWLTNASVAIKLSEIIRENFPAIKIVWGGGGIRPDTCSKFKDIDLIDHFVYGDAEHVITELLNGNTEYPGIDSHTPNQLDNLDEILLPDFKDIDWSLYDRTDNKITKENGVAHITGSRGCVRHCDFCDIWRLWPKFRFRSAEKILDEMLYYRIQHGIKFFYFNDSLINGNMKTYRKLLELLSTNDQAKDIYWHTQFVVRSERQMSESDWEMLSKTNVDQLEIGIESFSENIRNKMKKGFTSSDLDFTLKMTRKYKIPIALNVLTGYPFETEEDHQTNIDEIQKLYDDGYATQVDKNGVNLVTFIPVGLFALDKSQDTWDKVKDEIKNYKNHLVWEFRDNTYEVRKRRQLEILDVIYKNAEKHKVEGLWWGAKARYEVRLKERELGQI